MFGIALELLLLALRSIEILFREFYIHLSHQLSFFSTRHLRSAKRVNPRLSKPLHHLKASYDVVVVGSGYGGGVAASTMSRATPKQSVCVLERGSERWPGEYPNNLITAIAQLRFSGDLWTPIGHIHFHLGRRNGLYQWFFGKAASVLVGSGLGGTSLINAGVFLRPSGDVLRSSEWPEELQREGALDEYFEHAERWLQPTPFPANRQRLRKYEVLRKQAQSVGLDSNCYLVPQTTAFSTTVNAAGVTLQASSLSGRDTLGNNDGSKNTVLASYLNDATAWGAEIFCGCDVKYVAKNPGGGYTIFFRDSSWTSLLATGTRAQLSWVHAKKLVFMGAGSIGTTEIMLRSRSNGLETSPLIGTGMSGNGSMLAFGYNLNERTNSLATQVGSKSPSGPTITGTIDCRGPAAPNEGFLIQEGVFPPVMATLFRFVHRMLPCVPFSLRGLQTSRLRNWLERVVARADILQYSQVYLVLGHDKSIGKMSLRNDRPSLDMRSVADPKRQLRIQKILVAMTHALGGDYKSDGVKACVHPLGGMNMSHNGAGQGGATSHAGEVFTGQGVEVHDGLIVVDGALIPRSLGANPLATITSLATRVVHLAAQRDKLVIRHCAETITRSDMVRDIGPQIAFSETMRGDITLDGVKWPSTLSMNIRITRQHGDFVGKVSGSLLCRAMSEDAIRIVDGTFRPFLKATDVPCTWMMAYELHLMTSAGQSYRLDAVKQIKPEVAFSPRRTWQATTTMRGTVCLDDDGKSIGNVQFSLSIKEFLRQLRSLSVSGPTRNISLQACVEFLQKFAKTLAGQMFLPFAPLQYQEDASSLNEANNRKRAPDEVLTAIASDGYESPLRMWEPTEPSIGAAVLFVPGGAVTHEIYDLQTIRQNAIEYFSSKGYHCWCVTHRASTIDPAKAQKRPWTAFDARLDVAAAVSAIEQRHVGTPILVIAHCVGSVATASGLLDGTIPKDFTAGVVASQSFLHPLYAPLNEFKLHLPLVKLYRLFAGNWYPCDSTREDRLIHRILSQCLRFYPQTSRAELCNSNLCHRTQLPYGRLWEHANLNEATHSRLHEIFSGTSADCIEQLAMMGLKGEVADDQGRSLLMYENVERLRGIPVFLISGGASQVFRPEATLRSFEFLRRRFGEDAVRRKVFEGIGHLDTWMSDICGQPGSVFDCVAEELERMLRKRRGGVV